MTYAKHKTAQAEFVAAWWEAQDRKAREKLKRHYPGIETVSFFGGMEYADKLRNIPNNALRRAGFQHWLETTQKQPYFGRVMIHKNEPFLRLE